MFFDSSYWDLLLLFKINVVLLSVMFFFLICLLCLGGLALLSFGGGLPIPGKSEEEEDEKDRRVLCLYHILVNSRGRHVSLVRIFLSVMNVHQLADLYATPAWLASWMR